MEMTDFEIENGILKKYLSTGENVNIPEGVTSIGDGAFWGCPDLTTVTIPKSVKTIGVHAFRSCKCLTGVMLPENITSIGRGAFLGCGSLMNMIVPKSVTDIGDCAFTGCRSLANQDGFVIVNGILFDYFGTGSEITVPEGVMKFTEGTEPTNPEEIGLSSGIASKLNIGIGDTIKVNYGKGKRDVIITGIYETFNNLGEGVRLSADAPIPMGSQGGIGYAFVKYTDNPSAKTEKLRAERIRKNYDFEKVYEAWEFCAEMTGAAGPINAMKYLLLMIALIIVALVSVLMERTFIAAEKNQIALLKAIGFNDGKIVFWHVFRFATVTLLARFLGLSTSSPLETET